jgi:hypothetical protein
MDCNGRVWHTRGTPIVNNPINSPNQTKGKGSPVVKQIRTNDPLYESILNEPDDFDHAYAELDAQIDNELKDINFTSKRKGAAKDRRASPAYVYRVDEPIS